MEDTKSTDPILARLRAMRADSFRAGELHQMQAHAAQRLRHLARQLALHLAISSAPLRTAGKRRSLAAGRQRERRTLACQALAEEMILQALAHMHDPQWDPCADAGLASAPAQEHASLLLSLLQMNEAGADHGEQALQEDDAWMEP